MLCTGEEMTRQVEDITRRKEELLLQAASIREKVKNFGADNAGMLSELGIVSGVGHYWVWCNLVENCNTELVLALETGTHTEMVDSFNSLNEINTSLKESKVLVLVQVTCSFNRINFFQCENLKNYVSSTTKYWRRSIELKIVAALEEAITSIGWPFVQLSDTKKHQEAVKSVSIQELQELVKCLILISDDHNDADCDKDQMFVTQPMKIFLRPLRRRFKYHFLGTKTTNNPAKPEWYTTQLILWASLHSTFLDSNIQPVYDELGLAVPAKLELGYGLVCLARDKLSLDLPLILTDDVLLAHSIDEAIVLARDLAAKLQYSSAQPSPLSPLTRGQIFSRWINMERKFAFEKLDNVFTGDGAWTPDIGDNLVPSAAQSFLAVLLSVTERYKYLPLSQHRLQFLQLQLELLEDFRLRLVQLLRPENEEPLQSNLCPILCTVHHLMTILASWAETPFFLQLEHQKQEQAGGEMTGTVFDEAISKLEYLLTDMISTINNWIMYSVKSNSRQYRKEVKWFSYKMTVSGVQPAFCSVLQDISFNLETASKMLPESVFTKVWQELAVKIGKFICEEVILVNSFNVDGAKQLESDLRQGLLPIFGEFTLRPEAHFPVLMVRNYCQNFPLL